MKLVAPRAPTPVIPASGFPTSHLPTDVVAAQVERLKLFCMVSGGLWLIGMVMEAWVFPGLLGAIPSRAAISITVAAVLTAAAIYSYVCYAPRSMQHKTDSGLWLMVLNAFYVALLETWARSPIELRLGQATWITVIILLSAMIMPSTPRKMTIAVIVAASMGPLGVWIAHLRGLPVPSLATTFLIYLPNYTCGLMAVTPSILFQRMGRHLREARELGSYELVEQLGAGGMGEVWRARHRLLAREAAIKLVRPEMLGAGSDDQARLLLRRFEREAQATAQLSSAHTIRLFDFGSTEDERFYYVMELLVGRDLETFVKEFGPIPADRTMFLLRQICHSLAEAHERGLIHRDIKPANIYVCRMGLDYDFIKVLDFGLVKFHVDQSAARTQTLMTADQGTMGTPAYMAPEIIMGPGDIDRRSDVYALGCVAYFMLTGQRVFEGNTQMQVLIEHVHTKPTPPSRRSAMLRIPPELDDIVMQCLEKDPEKRPQDAAHLRRMLEANQTCNAWSSARGAEWWRTHLPDLAAPLTFLDRPAS